MLIVMNADNHSFIYHLQDTRFMLFSARLFDKKMDKQSVG